MSLHDLACENTATTGTASMVLSGAAQGCNTWDNAGVTNGETVKYSVVTYDLTTHRPKDRETGTGVYTTSTKTCTRVTVNASTNGGSKISLTGLSEVTIMPFASDIGGGGGGVSYANYYNSSEHTIADNVDGQTVEVNTEFVDGSNLASVSGNVITFATSGDYMINVVVEVSSGGTAFNGRVGFYADTNYVTAFRRQGYATADGINDDEIYMQAFARVSAGNTLSFTMDNHTGVTLNYVLNEVTLEKIG
jgi:hypothetical protein